jgi:murein L,D-transpeptidase YcbB/YkuD
MVAFLLSAFAGLPSAALALDAPALQDKPGQAAPSRYFDREKLQQLAIRIESMQAGGPWLQLAGPVKLVLGSGDPAVTILASQLVRLGDLAESSPPKDHFDAELEAAVKAFQARHGLVVDGIVGAASRRALNQTPARRLARIKINLQRLDQLRVEPRHILVNIAAFELALIDQDQVLLRSRVVVGRPSRPTPEMVDRVVNLVLSPTWTPTPMIARLDILPKVVTDPGYLVREQIRVYDGWGADAREINPFQVNWAKVAPDRLHYRFRQDPGPSNSLGQVRFSLTNDADIYLHDTPHRELFEKPLRAFSSGCVRVAEARALALFALEANGGWSSERLEDTLATRRKQVIRLAKPLPIHLIYVTVWVDEHGVAQFRDDIYGLDVPAAAPRLIR